MRFGILAGVMALGASSLCGAHDFWIEPSSFRPEVGRHFAVSLKVGEHLVGTPVPFRSSHSVRFVLAGDHEQPIVGREGATPAAMVRAASEGLHVVAYQSDTTSIQLDAHRFEEYLAHEGLDRVIELRAERGESFEPGRELFSRHVRVLVAVGGPGGSDRPLGLPIELIAERNPYLLGPGASLPVVLLHEGEPLSNALVVATAARAPDKVFSARTDGTGRVEIPLTHPGVWLINTVHMVEAETGSGADWHSLWSSLTFELPAEPDR